MDLPARKRDLQLELARLAALRVEHERAAEQARVRALQVSGMIELLNELEQEKDGKVTPPG